MSHTLALPCLVVTSLVVAGCNSVHTSPAMLPPPVPVAGHPGSGIPYRLPAGLVTLDLTFPEKAGDGDGKISPTVKVGTSHYPDPTSPFLLLPDHSPFFDTHHKITVSNGLLSSISTTETSRISEAVLSLTETGINVAKIKTGGGNYSAQSDAPGSSADIFLNDDPQPTDAEIAFALKSALGAKLSLNLASTDHSLGPVPIGGARLLSVKRTISELSIAGRVSGEFGSELKPSKGLQAGIYTRALRPYRVEVLLVLDRTELNRLRRQAHERELTAAIQDQARMESEATTLQADPDKAEREYALAYALTIPLQVRISRLHLELARHDLTDAARSARSSALGEAAKHHAAAKDVADKALNNASSIRSKKAKAEVDLKKLKDKQTMLRERIIKYGGTPPAGADAANNRAPTAPAPTDAVVLHTVSAVVILPDPQSLIRMPITRATFGTTKNTIKFADGIVTEYDSEQPSSFAGLAALPASMTRAFLQALTGSGSATAPASTATSAAPPAATTPATGSGTP